MSYISLGMTSEEHQPGGSSAANAAETSRFRLRPNGLLRDWSLNEIHGLARG